MSYIWLSGIGDDMPPGWLNVKSYGAVGDGSTDDTSAIQTTINAVVTAGGGVVYFPLGVYKIAGAMQNTGQENSQLTLPRIDISASGQPLRIALVGASPPFQGWWNTYKMDNGGPILVSTFTGGNGTQSILAGYSAFSSGGSNFTGVHLSVRDLAFRCPVNPTLNALNLGGVIECDLDRVSCDVGGTSAVVGTWTQPSTNGATGIVFPTVNNGAIVKCGQATVAGYYYGYKFCEHLTGANLQAFACQYTAALMNGYHECHISRFGSYFSANGITVLSSSGTTPRLVIDSYAIEQGDDASTAAASPTKWPSRQGPTGYDFIDASNFCKGIVRYSVVVSNVGQQSTSWRANGASNMTFTSLG